MNFTIRKTSPSYRFLSRWSDEIKAYNKIISSDDLDDEDRKYVHRRLPATFCEYYRKVALIVMMLFVCGFCIGSIPMFLFTILTNPLVDPHHFLDVLLIISTVCGGFVLATLIAFGLVYLWIEIIWPAIKKGFSVTAKKIDSYRKPNYEEEKEPGFLSTLWYGVKHSVCPMIHYEVDEESEKV